MAVELTMAERLAKAAIEASNNEVASSSEPVNIPQVTTVSSETVAGKSKSGII